MQDLKNRLMEIRKQQEEVVKNSLDIIKEIDKVSSKLTWDDDESEVTDDHISKIQKLIQEFEATYKGKQNRKITKLSIYQKQDMQRIIENFENMNKIDVHKENVVLPCKTKDSSEKINTFWDKAENLNQQNQEKNECTVSDNIRDKINKFSRKQPKYDTPTTSKEVNETANNINVITQRKKFLCEENTEQDCCSYYASCCSSIASFQKFNPMDVKSDIAISKCSSTVTGYDGDKEDSDLELKYK